MKQSDQISIYTIWSHFRFHSNEMEMKKVVHCERKYEEGGREFFCKMCLSLRKFSIFFLWENQLFEFEQTWTWHMEGILKYKKYKKNSKKWPNYAPTYLLTQKRQKFKKTVGYAIQKRANWSNVCYSIQCLFYFFMVKSSLSTGRKYRYLISFLSTSLKKDYMAVVWFTRYQRKCWITQKFVLHYQCYQFLELK